MLPHTCGEKGGNPLGCIHPARSEKPQGSVTRTTFRYGPGVGHRLFFVMVVYLSIREQRIK